MNVTDGNLIVGDKVIPINVEEYMNVDNDYGVSIHDVAGVQPCEFPEEIKLRIGFHPYQSLIPWLSIERQEGRVVAYVELLCSYEEWDCEKSIDDILGVVKREVSKKLDIYETNVEPDIEAGKYFVWFKFFVNSDDLGAYLLNSLKLIDSVYRSKYGNEKKEYVMGPIKIDSWKVGPIIFDTPKIFGSIQKYFKSR